MPHYLMIRPACFGYNIETAASNSYQQLPEPRELEQVQQKALQEFDGLVAALREQEVDLLVMDDSPQPRKTCAVFPNNWFSTHEGGKLVLYPMLSANRRLERRPELIEALREQFEITEIIDLTHYEACGQYLEGTGSLVLDRENKIAYACLSPRTHATPLQEWAYRLGYELVPFTAVDAGGSPVYHTNVVMWLGKGVVGIALESILNPQERQTVKQRLEMTGKQLVVFSPDQMSRFCGNMLEVVNRKGESLLVMSQVASTALTTLQKQQIQQTYTLVCAPIPTIEALGGGSARCMIAEVVLSKKETQAGKLSTIS
ncbi:citrulline utilization hydrolase CtlX [Cesiribacter andamanensis]|uniref:Amidinotransferase n=1 Tax=Cesiribacter andamanensis AMV16 TaxID=1279009 RepID=M7N5V9_9BACT|nr:arginine deiminase-related protein [Cesiribacter andamanensis]EMR02626.1 hypothetical protein ADICEAN_02225 [Cesiribacter andamanensis AMV16]